MRKGNKASGISPEATEVGEALANLIEWFEKANSPRDKENTDRKRKEAEDLAKVQDIRRQSLCTFAESRKQKQVDKGDVTHIRSKKSDTASYLQQKSTHGFEIRPEELELKEKESNMQLQK